jgi:hypothetical protein
LSFFLVPETCTIFPTIFPQSPPRSYFNSKDDDSWVKHHERLQDFFSQFPFERVPHTEQVWKDGEDNIVFIFLPWQLNTSLQNFIPHMPKLKVSRYHCHQHKAGTLKPRISRY